MISRKSLATWAFAPMALALTGAAAPSFATDALAQYSLDMTISDNGELIAAPTLRVFPTDRSAVYIDKGDGRSYRAELSFEDAGDGKWLMHSQIDVTSPTVGTVSFQPELTIAEGQPARIEYGNVTPGVRPLRIELKLNAPAR